MQSLLKPAIAVVGSGPAGFYCTARLLRALPQASVSVFERRPVPFGLIRYGVAPDHPEVKTVTSKFSTLAESPNVSFFGNVEIGRDVSLEKLRAIFDAVVLCTGAAKSMPFTALERLILRDCRPRNVFTADEFVGWYNGAPEHAELKVDLSKASRAVVIGNGNAALDIARMLLLKGPSLDRISRSLVSARAFEALSKSTVGHVRILGRRGPQHVAFAAKELREILALPAVRVTRSEDGLADSELGPMLETLPRARRRLMQLLHSVPPTQDAASELHADAECRFDFFRETSEIEFKESPHGSRVATGLRLANTGDKILLQSAGESETKRVSADIVIAAVGWQPLSPDPSIAISSRRLVNEEGCIAERLYTAGWAQTGPSGTIAATLASANSVADRIAHDLSTECTEAQNNQPDAHAHEVLASYLLAKGHTVVDWNGWRRISSFENEHDRKIINNAEMLALASNSGI